MNVLDPLGNVPTASNVPSADVPTSMPVPRGLGDPSVFAEPQMPMVMKWTASGPVYYGTQQARDLAVQGLQRVRAGFGERSPRYRAALNAAMGVFGAGYTPAQIHSLVV